MTPSAILLLCSLAAATPAPSGGKALFETNCVRCHGTDGARGRFGAKDLRKSTLNDAQLFNTIANGRSVMPSWKNRLSEAQIKDVIVYIKTFRVS